MSNDRKRTVKVGLHSGEECTLLKWKLMKERKHFMETREFVDSCKLQSWSSYFMILAFSVN
jgi:hypothetical protein